MSETENNAPKSNSPSIDEGKWIMQGIRIAKTHGISILTILTLLGFHFNDTAQTASKADIAELKQTIAHVDAKVDAIAKHEGIIVASSDIPPTKRTAP